MKRINAVILGIITMISLGLILNVLFSDNEYLGQSRRRTELVSNQNNTVDEPDYLHEDDAEVLDDTDQDDDSTEETDSDDSSIQEQPNSSTEKQQSDSNLEEGAQTQPEENNTDNEESTENPQQNEQTQTSRAQQQPDSDGDSSEEEDNLSQVDEKPLEPAEEDNEEEEVSNNVSIIIDARQNGGSHYIGEIPYERGDTALDILLRFTQNRGISVSLSNEMANRNIFEIDGHKISDIDGRWDLYINGYRSLHEAGANKITPNSTIRYHYNTNINE